jgi:hypothetical protein
VLGVLERFVECGGLHGMLSGVGRFHSASPAAYVTGTGTRTVMMTGLSEAMAATVNARPVDLTCTWEKLDRDVTGPAWSPEMRMSSMRLNV